MSDDIGDTQDQEMMINVLSAALRNAYVINSFSAPGASQGPSQLHQEQLGGSVFNPQQQQQQQRRNYAPVMPHAESLPILHGLNSPIQQAQLQSRMTSSPEGLAWQARQLRENLYAHMSLDSVGAPPRVRPHSLSNADIAYHSLQAPAHPRSSVSDLSSRMSLSDMACLSFGDYGAISHPEAAGQPAHWAAGPYSQQYGAYSQQQQLMNAQDPSMLQSGAVYSAEPLTQQHLGQADAILSQQRGTYNLSPSLPPLNQPYPTCLDSRRQSGTQASGRPSPGSSPTRQGTSGQAGAFETTIRASLISQWQQQQQQTISPRQAHAVSGFRQDSSASQLPQQASTAEAAADGTARQVDGRDQIPAPQQNGIPVQAPASLGQHVIMPADVSRMAEASLRSSSESTRFSMESLRRSVESMRYSVGGRPSSHESSTGRYSSSSPRMSDPTHGQESLFAYQSSHPILAPMASVPETEPVSGPLLS